jgi:type II secretory pathway pseudopilin PulG
MKISKSFGLIEVVAAAGIFIIFIGSLVTLSSTSSRNIIINKHRLQAANLAREGIEMVREIRDTAWRNDVSWSDLKEPCWGLAGNLRRLENYQGELKCDYWHYHLVNGNEIISIDNVQYTRNISINDWQVVNPNDAKTVTVTVSWNDFGRTRTVTMITYLTNWN